MGKGGLGSDRQNTAEKAQVSFLLPARLLIKITCFFPICSPPISVLFVNCEGCVNSAILSACKQILTFVLSFHSHCPVFSLKGTPCGSERPKHRVSAKSRVPVLCAADSGLWTQGAVPAWALCQQGCVVRGSHCKFSCATFSKACWVPAATTQDSALGHGHYSWGWSSGK